MRANEIIKLLSEKHKEDVFVSELKSGSSINGKHYRLDGWAMQKSWVRPRVIGYEVKVSRSDFKQDDKWQQYLDVCNELYFVCPHGLIDIAEIPEGVGLIQSFKNGGGLRTVKKAAHRKVIVPESVYRYILFSRAKILAPNTLTEKQDADYWKNWMSLKKDDLNFGRQVATRLGYEKRRMLEDTKAENDKLRNENAKLQEVKDFLKDNGLNTGWNYKRAVEQKVKAAQDVVPPHFIGALQRMDAATKELLEIYDSLNHR